MGMFLTFMAGVLIGCLIGSMWGFSFGPAWRGYKRRIQEQAIREYEANKQKKVS